MNRLVVGLLVVGILASGVGAALLVGVEVAPGVADDASANPGTPFPTGTPYDGGSDGGGAVGSTGGSAAPPPFSFAVDSIEECGQTCRDVTVTLQNNQNDTANGVTVFTRIFAGQDNTDPDDLVWETEVGVGTLEAGGSYTTTERVELSLGEAFSIQQEGGWVTVLTTVRSDERTVTFKESEQVA